MCIWIKGVLRNFCFVSATLFVVFLHQLAKISISSFCNIFIHFLSCKYDWPSACWNFHILITSWPAQLLSGFSSDHHPFPAPTLTGPSTLTTYMLSLHPRISFPNTKINVTMDFPALQLVANTFLISRPRLGPAPWSTPSQSAIPHLVRYSIPIFSHPILHNNF